MEMQAVQSVAQMRERARAALPRAIFDFADGGAQDEHTLRANEQAFKTVSLLPRPLRGAGQRDLSIDLFGRKLAMPLMVGPAGLAGLFWPDGELAAASAAQQAGIGMCLSHGSVCTLEQFVQGTKDKPVSPRWMQVFVYRDRAFTESFVQRALASQYDALVLTVDNQLIGKRERDRRNGFGIPPSFSIAQRVAMLSRWRWLVRMRTALPSLTFGNYVDYLGTSNPAELAGSMAQMLDPALSWADVQWLRRLWPGTLLIKGLMHPDEARRAVDEGVDGIICSNHGGRQLDGAAASFAALPLICAAVDRAVPVLLDGGVRRGTDVIKALAMGATACLIGRPWLWGLSVAGQAGVSRVLEIYRDEIDRDLGLLGCAAPADINVECLLR